MCWVVEASRSSDKVRLTVLDSRMESSSSCSYDYVEIRDGNINTSPLLIKFCGTTLPSPMESSDRHLYVRFRTDSSDTDRGFNMSIRALSGCINVLVNRVTTKYITSPNYPNNYPNNIDMCWVVEASGPSDNVRLATLDSRMESSSSCRYDYAEIRDGNINTSPLLTKFCGSTIPSPMKSSRRHLYVGFRTDHSNRDRGFKMSIRASGCIIVLVNTATTKYITSPNYPNNYPNNIDMCWVLQSSIPSNNVRLDVLNSSMETGWLRCSNDFVELRDGNSVLSPNRVKFCGRTKPLPIRSTTQYLYVRFRTNSYNTYSGFRFSVKAVPGCNDVIVDTDLTKFIQSPNYPNDYPNNIDVCWVMQATPPSHLVRLAVVNSRIENSSSCTKDSVEIMDGQNIRSSLKVKFCGSTMPQQLRSSGPYLFVRFQTDTQKVFPGFKIRARRVPGYRSEVVTTRTTSYIQSPNYPYNYPNNIDMAWLVWTASQEGEVRLSVFNSGMESSADCTRDYVEIRNGRYCDSPLIMKLCGTKIPPPIRSTGRHVYVRFKTDSNNVYSGFRMSILAVPGCTEVDVTTSTTKYITSPGYPSPYPNNKDICWTIRATPSSGKVRLVVLNSKLEGSFSDFVAIRDGQFKNSSLRVKFCAETIPTLNPSSGPYMYIRFKSDSSRTYSGFRISATAVAHIGCTDVHVTSSPTRYIKSPNYPSNYSNYLDICWVIQATQLKMKVNLTVLTSRLESSMMCSYDFVDIRDGQSENSTLQTKFCGEMVPNPIISKGPYMYVRFKTDSTTTFSGFRIGARAVFNIACAYLHVSTHTRSYIYSPNYPQNYPNNVTMCWVVQAAQIESYTVELTVHSSHIQSSVDCLRDYVEIRDGQDQDSQLRVKFCGSTRPHPIRSSSRSMYILFNTDGHGVSSGFWISARAVPRLVPTAPHYVGLIVGCTFGSVAAVIILIFIVVFVKKTGYFTGQVEPSPHQATEQGELVQRIISLEQQMLQNFSQLQGSHTERPPPYYNDVAPSAPGLTNR